mmetsp:Transcript_43911/g.68675  ORF Transcript_43911/g.68675 Transcript_43911/m.68675 type:complete len:330 (-) Transcript_43911:495-1484(-)
MEKESRKCSCLMASLFPERRGWPAHRTGICPASSHPSRLCGTYWSNPDPQAGPCHRYCPGGRSRRPGRGAPGRPERRRRLGLLRLPGRLPLHPLLPGARARGRAGGPAGPARVPGACAAPGARPPVPRVHGGGPGPAAEPEGPGRRRPDRLPAGAGQPAQHHDPPDLEPAEEDVLLDAGRGVHAHLQPRAVQLGARQGREPQLAQVQQGEEDAHLRAARLRGPVRDLPQPEVQHQQALRPGRRRGRHPRAKGDGGPRLAAGRGELHLRHAPPRAPERAGKRAAQAHAHDLQGVPGHALRPGAVPREAQRLEHVRGRQVPPGHHHDPHLP